MDRVTVFLRTSLFSFGGPNAHLPAGVMVIECTIAERLSGGLIIETDRMLDERGRELSDISLTLQLPWAKVDHIWVAGD